MVSCVWLLTSRYAKSLRVRPEPALQWQDSGGATPVSSQEAFASCLFARTFLESAALAGILFDMSEHRMGRAVLEQASGLLLGAALFTHNAAAQTFPFILPWNDASPGITDFSAFNTAISTQRVTVSAEGHFAVNGERVRFLGVNFAGDSPFMPTNKAEAVAARLAKFGVNNVRFHHMDASWATGGGLLAYTSSSSTNINANQLERLHFLISRLKAHGVSVNINLLVGREYRAGDGLGPEVASMDWKDAHVLGFFYPPALASQKDYATKLLTASNRFTGLSLAKDPAVAFVEIINENGIIQKWFDGGLDNLPQRYATNLQARWNGWLAGKYASDSSLAAGWRIIDQPLGMNMLRNGAFTNALTSWNQEQHEAARANFARTFDFTNGQPSARIVVTSPDSVSWHIQFNQANLRLSAAQAYTISFWAKSTPATNADVSVMRAHTDYAGLGFNQVLGLTTNWQRFTGTFAPSENETNARVNFGSMGNKAATFWLADARLQPGGQLGMFPPGTSLAGRNIPNIRNSGSGYTGTREARRDWLAFLRDMENAYYDEMVAHVRGACGYPGLIFGTIMANSPASVQSRMDVIDGHAYWQHPEFPATPWDSRNWTVKNISMVNTLDNTLSGLARQRVKGKPFTVTEYQHSSPNYYGAEGPLLIATYGALQDWDGIWLFDYGPGQDSASMGYVRGFFEIGQHPTKMATMLLAANIFRRGDVRTAFGEQSVTLGPDRELDLLEQSHAWGIFSSSQLGVPGKLAFKSRLSTLVVTNNPPDTIPPLNPPGNIMVSDTGQLTWNLSDSTRGRVTVNTPKTRAIVGFADNGTFDLGGFVFQPATTMLGWCALGVTLRNGQTMTNDCSLLAVATGWWENTGQTWTDPTKQSVANQWGRAPVLTEAVPFTLRIPAPAGSVRFWELNARGVRTRQLPVTGTSSLAVLATTTNSQTIFYEIEIGRWTTSFNSWRLKYFTLDELNAPELSGAAAAPDGDGVPNLLKYLYGLPGKSYAPTERLPEGKLFSLKGEVYLAMDYWRDKLANDVRDQVQLCSELPNWLGCCIAEEVWDDGPLERVTARDLQPASASGSRFMRLTATLQ